jgi:hypothetical protein
LSSRLVLVRPASDAEALRPAQQIDPKNLRRQSLRPPEEQAALELQRELAWLSHKFPRFRDLLNQARGYVQQQQRSPRSKCALVMRALKPGMLSRSEVMEDTRLDALSVQQALDTLMRGRNARVECVSRDGSPIVIRSNGRPWPEPFYRLRSGQTSPNGHEGFA